jgi:hypothetical protein
MSSSDALWLKIWTTFAAVGFVIVIIGVIIEGVEHFKKFKKQEHSRKLQIEKLGWFMVVIGLAMEFLGDHAAKRISDRENARLNKEAGDARQDAGSAIERAGLAEKKAGEANERAAMTESNNLVLRSNIVELEVVLSDRIFSPAVETVNSLRKFAGQKFMVIDDGSEESGHLDVSMQITLMNAKWERVALDSELGKLYFEHEKEGDGIKFFEGVEVVAKVGMEDKETDAADNLVEELNKVKITTNRYPFPNIPPDVIVIKIGKKPDFRDFKSEKIRNEIEKEMDDPKTTPQRKRELFLKSFEQPQ